MQDLLNLGIAFKNGILIIGWAPAGFRVVWSDEKNGNVATISFAPSIMLQLLIRQFDN